MEKLFSIVRRENEVIFVAPEGDEIKLQSDQKLTIAKWEERDTKPWAWELRLVENGKAVVANQLMKATIEYSSPAMYLGDKGIGIMLGGSKPRANRIELSVFDLMRKLNVRNLDFHLPTEESWYANRGMHTVKVYDLKHKEQKSANGIFTLDPKQPWFLRLTRIVGTNKKEWSSLYIPYGWKPETEERKAEYQHPEQEQSTMSPACEALETAPVEEAVVEETVGTPVISEEVAAKLDPAPVEVDVAVEAQEKQESDGPEEIKEPEGVTLQ